MTRRQIEKRISELLNDYGYSDTWPQSYQREYEQLCAALDARKTHRAVAR